MSRSFRLIVLASASFGLATGCYDFLLPFYMQSRNVSFGNMGLIFSLSGLAMVIGRILVGRHSDRVGRKPFFLTALGMLSVSTMLVPTLTRGVSLFISRTMTEISKELRLTVHSVIVFDHVGERFLRFIGRASGPVFIMEGVGVILAGFLLRWTNFTWTFVLMGAQLGAITLIFRNSFQEGEGLVRSEKDSESLLSWHLPKELWLISLAGFLQVAGMSASHCFVMPLFFRDRFGLSPEQVALILAMHRITLGAPMLTSGITWGMSQRTVWVVFSTAQSVTMLATGLAPSVVWAVAFWWAHDLIGGGIWDPVRQHYIQRYCRHGHRGHDLGRVSALSSLGWVVGPLVAGWLYPISPGLPFIASGAIASLSVLPVLLLPKNP